jgi:nitroreductase
MELNEAIFGRRATREYTQQIVDEVILNRLLLAAVQAPSAVNQQPWLFTVVRNQGILDLISRDAKAHVMAAMPGPTPAEHVHGPLRDPDFHIFYHAPALILISVAATGPWVIEDCALAAENLMLAAHGAGLGSCWIGFAQSYLNTTAGKKALNVPTAWISVAPIIVGHPRATPTTVPRRAPVVRWVG